MVVPEGISRGAGRAPVSAGIAADEAHANSEPAPVRPRLGAHGGKDGPKLPPVAEMEARGQRAATLVAITLADDFRLPAAVMHEAGLAGSGALTGEAQRANRRLIDGFYSELAAAAERESEGSDSARETDAPADVQGSQDSVWDVTVHPGGFGERVRSAHDERFRALFGDGAYNRRLLEAAIERTLPALPVSPGAE
jgi:hypothetical protein